MKKMSRNHTVGVGVLILLLVSLFFLLGKGLGLDPNRKPSSQTHHKATEFTLEWLQGQDTFAPHGENLSLSLFKGKKVVLNFWASWCASCGEEAQEIESFWKEYQNKDVVVLGVAVHDDKEAAQKFLAKFGGSFPIGLDTKGTVSLDYGVSGVPETFLLDENGIILDRITGPITREMLKQKLHLP